ncbi:MAG: helix-turn-helix domain-containing protein, partial [Lachnospiraceae bacterium]|nr:helix-turn-helix domain-containing protein [Lachnospiraceae bacterium]
EAVHLEVEEYILKPAGAEELREVFTRLHKSMDEERDEKRNVEKLKDYYLQSLPLLQANFYTSLIEGRIPEEKLPHFLVDYQIDLDAPSYVCVDLHTSSAGLPEEVTTLLVTMSVQRYFEENVSKQWRAKFFSYLGDTVMIAQIDAPGLVRTLTDEMDHLCMAAKKITGALVTAGIGAVVLQLSEIAESYSGARKAVSLRKLYGGGKSINIMEASDDKKDYVAKALAYTGEHYNDPKLSLDFLCGKLNVSNSYFSTLFKKKTGKSFVAYLTEFRMQQAARMLEETAEKNYRIAESVGYEDANYFSYVFKKQYGCSPSTYRTAHKTA